MALITCKDCKKEFSTDAKRCPHCGAKKPINSLKFVLATVGVLVLVAFCSNDNHDAGKDTSKTETSHDVDNLYSMAELLKANNAIVSYEVSGWNHRLDVNISSLLPGDARALADGICSQANEKFMWTYTWTIRVFLVVGDKPAAECQILPNIKMQTSDSSIKAAPSDQQTERRAASFDCSKARSTLEVLICSDPELSSLDGQVGESYSQAHSSVTADSKLSDERLKEQRQFLQKRTESCPIPVASQLSESDTDQIISCLKTFYTARLNALESQLTPVQNSKCYSDGEIVILQGMASVEQQTLANDTVKSVWILNTDTPLCVIQSLSKDHIDVSRVQIIGTPPPIGTKIELRGALSTENITHSAEPTIIKVISGRHITEPTSEFTESTQVPRTGLSVGQYADTNYPAKSEYLDCIARQAIISPPHFSLSDADAREQYALWISMKCPLQAAITECEIMNSASVNDCNLSVAKATFLQIGKTTGTQMNIGQ